MADILAMQLTSIGAPVYVALFVVSLVAMATAVYKIVQFWQMGVGRRRATDAALARWTGGDTDGGLRQALSSATVLARVAAAVMSSLLREPNNHERARDVSTHEAIQILNSMTKNLRILEAVVQAAPMLGLLGTVIGMIKAFNALSQGGGAVDPGALAGGIWVSLLTTAAGLAIAIPFYFVSIWLEGRVERERSAMELMIEGLIQHQSDLKLPSDTRFTAVADTRTMRSLP